MKHLHDFIRTALRPAVIAMASLLAACGGSDAPLVPQGTLIGSAGGTVAGPAGAAVVIPAGALAVDTPIEVAQSSAGAPALPTGLVAAGPIFAFTPHGTTFAQPVTVTVPFDPATVPVNSAPLLYKSDAGGAWALVGGTVVGSGLLSGQVSAFSYVVGTVAAPSSGTSRLTFNLRNAGRGLGGAVMVDPLRSSCTTAGGVCAWDFATGTLVTLTVVPYTGSRIGGWTGCDSTIGDACSLTMTSDRTVDLRLD